MQLLKLLLQHIQTPQLLVEGLHLLQLKAEEHELVVAVEVLFDHRQHQDVREAKRYLDHLDLKLLRIGDDKHELGVDFK